MLLLAALLTAALPTGIVRGIKAIPHPVQVQQPDGTWLTVRIHGDEQFHYTTTMDGLLIARHTDGYFHYLDDDRTLSPQRVNETDRRTPDEQDFVRRLTPVRKTMVPYTLIPREAKVPSRLLSRDVVAPQLQAGEQAVESQYLVILVGFTDCPFTFQNADFDIWLNQTGYAVDGGTGSVKDYYRDNSMGQFIPNFHVLGPFTLSKDQTYYAGNSDETGEDTNPRVMIAEAVKLAKAAHPEMDFGMFDNDKDGYMDNVNVIYAGYSEASTGNADDMWPHSWSMKEEAFSVDGIVVDNYSCSAEFVGSSGQKMDGIGTFVHEFGHILGLKDMYDTDEYTDGYGLDPGDYSLYASGSYNNESRTPPCLMAFERMQMGWLSPTELKDPEDAILPPLAENAARYIDAQPDRTPGTGVEYFILENRQQTGWDTYLPAHGLLIYHYDYTDEMVEKYWSVNGPNNNAKHRCLYIKPADGIDDTNTRGGDTYPGRSGNTAFTDTSTPNALNWAGKPTGVPVTNIREEGGIVYFQVKGGVTPLSILRTGVPTDIRDTSAKVTATIEQRLQEIVEMGFCWAMNSEPTLDSPLQAQVSPADQAEYVMNGLEPGSLYNVRAYMKQADGQVVYGAAIPFKTECQVAEAPYIADFTSWTNNEPDCWKIVDNNADGTTWVFDKATQGMLYQFDYWNDADDWLISTRMRIPEDGALFFVRGVVDESCVENLDVYVSTRSREVEDFHLVKQFSFADNFGYQMPEEVDLKEFAGQEVYVAFVCRSEKMQASLWLWQIYLTRKLGTPVIETFDLTDKGLLVEWTPIEDASKYYLVFAEVTDEVFTTAVFLPESAYSRIEGDVTMSTGKVAFTGNGVAETIDYPDGINNCAFVLTSSGPFGTTIVTIEGTCDGETWTQLGPTLRVNEYNAMGTDYLLGSYMEGQTYKRLRFTCQHGGRNVTLKYLALEYNEGYVWNVLAEGGVDANSILITPKGDEFVSDKTYAAEVYAGDGILFYDASKPAYYRYADSSIQANTKGSLYIGREAGGLRLGGLAEGTRLTCTTPAGQMLYTTTAASTSCLVPLNGYRGLVLLHLDDADGEQTIKVNY